MLGNDLAMNAVDALHAWPILLMNSENLFHPANKGIQLMSHKVSFNKVLISSTIRQITLSHMLSSYVCKTDMWIMLAESQPASNARPQSTVSRRSKASVHRFMDVAAAGA